jgi:flagellar hook-associated protein 3 FlgL
MATINRSSYLSTYNGIQRGIAEAQSNMSRVNEQIALGKKGKQYSDYAVEDVSRQLSLESDLQNLKQIQQGNFIISQRLEVIDNVVDGLHKLTADAMRFAQNINNPVAVRSLNVADTAKQFLQDIETRLNLTFDGSYIFAGVATDKKPVAGVGIFDNIDDDNYGEVTDNYYRGSSKRLQWNNSLSTINEYGFTANEEPFQQLIGAMHYMLRGAAANNSPADYQKATDLLARAEEGLRNMRSVSGNQLGKIKTANDIMSNQITFIEEKIREITDVDTPNLTYVSALQKAKLDATYMLASRTTKLSLLDYI